MLEQIMSLLGISEATEEMTNKLNYIIANTQQRLMLRLGTDYIPTELQYVVVEVSIVRFNRIGSEMLTSHNVEGESMQWGTEDDFKPYQSEINAWVSAQSPQPKSQGRLRFV